MKLVGQHQIFLNALQLAQGVTDTKGMRPVLKNVRFVVHADRKAVELLATDGQMTLQQTVALTEVDEDFSMILPVDKLCGVLRETQGDVSLSYEENTATLQIDKSRFKIIGDVSGDFPVFPTFQEEGAWEMPPAFLQEMAIKTMFACTEDTSRYAMNGVFLSVEDKDVTMVSTDGRRLAKIQRKLKKKVAKPQQAILSVKSLTELSKILTNEKTKLQLTLTDTSLQVMYGDIFLTARLVEGRFPEYEAVIPSNNNQEAIVDRVQLASALRQAKFLMDADMRVVQFAFQEGKLEIKSSDPRSGQASIEIPCEGVVTNYETGFDPVFLLDMLNVVEEEKIRFFFGEESRAAIIKAEDQYLYVLMPIKVAA